MEWCPTTHDFILEEALGGWNGWSISQEGLLVACSYGDGPERASLPLAEIVEELPDGLYTAITSEKRGWAELPDSISTANYSPAESV